MKKFCVVETFENGEKQKVSRFFNTEQQAKNRITKPNQFILTKVSCIEQGLFTIPKRKNIQRHIDISLVSGVKYGENYPVEQVNTRNQSNYIFFCIRNGYIVPRFTKSSY